MIRRISISILSLLLAVVGLVLFTATAPTAHAGDKDCGDFPTQAAAQAFFIKHGGPRSDPHGLDSEGDGVACESNPCPCSTSQGGGDGGGKKKAHIIRVRGVEVRQTSTFRAVGKVLTYRGKIQLQRKYHSRTFKTYKRTQARKPNGRVSVGFDSPVGACFRIMVPETKKYRLTYKKIGCIVRG